MGVALWRHSKQIKFDINGNSSNHYKGLLSLLKFLGQDPSPVYFENGPKESWGLYYKTFTAAVNKLEVCLFVTLSHSRGLHYKTFYGRNLFTDFCNELECFSTLG